MVLADYIVILVYVIGILAVGVIFSGRIKDARDMFAAGGQSPWWVSGMSSFMTMFSAGTFVVWGGIAYRYGMVAVAISMCYGVAAFIVGFSIAARWRRMGITSAAEFIEIRFGKAAVQFYTWLQVTLQPFFLGAAIHSLSILFCAMIPLPEGHILVDPATQHLSTTLMSMFLVVLITLYTIAGGLWAVLMTDVLQFIVLTVSVVLVVPLCLMEVGGWSEFVRQAPQGFLDATSQDYTWVFLFGWVILHVFKIGAEWSFAQRFLCVPTEKDARKSSFLFGILYLVSPWLWMLPPMIYRVIDPSAHYEEAYILACRTVLPAGMVGLMMAAMLSATASMADTMLNVFAGAVLTEIYQKYIRPQATQKHLVFAGRVITLLLGVELMAGTLIIPRIGTVTGFTMGLALLSGTLLIPTVWGLYSRRVGFNSIWITAAVSFPLAMITKFGMGANGWFAGVEALQGIVGYYQTHMRVADIVVGFVPSFLIMLILELTAKGESQGWRKMQAVVRKQKDVSVVAASRIPGQMVAVSVGILALLMWAVALAAQEQRSTLIVSGLILASISAGVGWAVMRRPRKTEAVQN